MEAKFWEMESTQILTSNSYEALVLIFVVLNRSLGRDGRDAGTQDVGAWFWPWSIADLVRIWSLYHTLYHTTRLVFVITLGAYWVLTRAPLFSSDGDLLLY